MGIMDDVRKETRPAGTGAGFLGTDERHQMVELHTPFYIVAMRRGTSAKFNKDQWFVDVEFIDPATGLSYTVTDGETGEEVTVRRCVTFGASDNRDQEFPVIKRKVEEGNGYLGPLMLAKVAVAGQPNPAYIFADWDQTPNGAAAPAPAAPAAAEVPPPPPPPARQLSPDGLFEWDGTQWLRLPPPPPAAPPPPPDVIPATLPFSQATEADARTSVATPPLGTSQPLPEVAYTQTGGDGEGGQATVVAYKGDQIRQAVYQGDGVVQTPQGGLIATAAPTHESDRPVGTGGIAQQPPPPPPPPPAQEPVQAVATAVPEGQIPANEKPARVMIPMQGKCQFCNKTAKGSSFKDSKGRWILTHKCDSIDPATSKARGSVIVDVNDQVLAILAAAKEA